MQDERPEGPRHSNTWIIVAAVAGGCLVFFLMLTAILAAILFPVFARARENARKATCQCNMKNLAFSMQLYTQDYDQRFAPVGTWTTSLFPYVKSQAGYCCPTVSPGMRAPAGATVPSDYAYNAALGSTRIDKVASPAQSVVFFEGTPSSAAGGPRDVAAPGRHLGGNSFVFADGHIKWYLDGGWSSLTWSPRARPATKPTREP